MSPNLRTPRRPKEVGEYLEFFYRKRRHPHGTSQDPEERRLADWAIEVSIRIGSAKHPEAKYLVEIPNFFNCRNRNPEQQAFAYKRCYEITELIPTRNPAKNSEAASDFAKGFGVWAYRNNEFKMDGTINKDKRWSTNLADYLSFRSTFERLPLRTSDDEKERFLALWAKTQRASDCRTLEQIKVLIKEGVISEGDKSYKLAMHRARRDELAAQMGPYPGYDAVMDHPKVQGPIAIAVECRQEEYIREKITQ